MNKNGNLSIVSAAWVWKQFYLSILIILAKSQTLLDIYKSIKEGIFLLTDEIWQGPSLGQWHINVHKCLSLSLLLFFLWVGKKAGCTWTHWLGLFCLSFSICSTSLIFNQFAPSQNLLVIALSSLSLKKKVFQMFQIMERKESERKEGSREGGRK